WPPPPPGVRASAPARARGLAGVLAVFTGHDLVNDGVPPIPTLIAERGGGIGSRDGSKFAEPIWLSLATKVVRHVGEPVALVVATTPAAARDGAEAVVARYAARSAGVVAGAALAGGAPPLPGGRPGGPRHRWGCRH